MSKKRIASTTDFYHVMCRGNNREEIFKKKVDKKKLLNALKAGVVISEIQIYAYCIMNNHYHLLIKTTSLENLGIAMQRINSYYAHYYKLKYTHEGHVFQDRFLSKPLNEVNYIGNVMRYIHQNPIKAGLAKEMKEYEFSSYKEYGASNKNNIIKNGGWNLIEMFGSKDIKEFQVYHKEKQEINKEAKREIFFDLEEYRYEDHLVIKEIEREKICKMRNEIKNYESLSLGEKRDFAKTIISCTANLSIQEIAKFAGVGRNRLKVSGALRL